MICILTLNFINLILSIFYLKKHLHIYQLKDYKFSRYFKYFSKKYIFFIIFNVFSVFFQCFLRFFIKLNYFYLIIFIINILLITINFILNHKLIKSKKTPLNFTNKAKRIYFLSAAILIMLSFNFLSVPIINISLIFIVPFSNLLNIYDKIKNKNFIRSAQKKLSKSKTKIIAITGSNGKTSVKNILYEMLNKNHKTQTTPLNYNTPLGISKFINTGLNSDTEFLILEYGARQKNDIKNLCKMFGADLGIITTVSPQHLETFKTIDNIYSAKGELSKYLKNKFCVFNFDNSYTRKMCHEKSGKKTSISISTKKHIYADNIKIINFETHFDLHIKNKTYHTKTKLLGKHNITNILLATAMANHLAMPHKNILSAIENLQPTPHRIEYIRGKINILDDSYNCSLDSAKQAVEVLLSCCGKKFVITPGIIEGGSEQYPLNYELGKLLSSVDTCIIVGEYNKKAISDGLKSQNFNNFYCVKSLEDASKHYSTLTNNDTLLFLNDLPDDYNWTFLTISTQSDLSW